MLEMVKWLWLIEMTIWLVVNCDCDCGGPGGDDDLPRVDKLRFMVMVSGMVTTMLQTGK